MENILRVVLGICIGILIMILYITYEVSHGCAVWTNHTIEVNNSHTEKED